MSPPAREDWPSRSVFLLAVLGSAIGLANFWRFPYLVGEYGGGAFVLVYLLFCLAICVPLVMTELAMGRRGHRNPVTTLRILCAEDGRSRFWLSIGWLSIFPTLGVLCFFSVVAGWSLEYIVRSVSGDFVQIGPDAAAAVFDELQASPARMFFWHSVYMALTVIVVGRGIRRGIGLANKVMMPGLVLSVLILVVYAQIEGDAARAFRFLFRPDFGALSGEAVLMALGQALASIGVGTGALLTYGSYVPPRFGLAAPSWTIVLGDTAMALLAGLAIFPVVFAAGLDPASGPGLTFLTLPIAIGNVPGGYLFSIVFFVLLFFAAFTASLSMLEPSVSWLVDKGYRRLPATLGIGGVVWILATGSVLSFNVLSDFAPLSFIPVLEGRTIFGILEYTAANIMLPLNTLLIALFAGWAFRSEHLLGEIGITGQLAAAGWRLAVRYVAPVAVVLALVYGLTA